jgi:hypothetical protein
MPNCGAAYQTRRALSDPSVLEHVRVDVEFFDVEGFLLTSA